MTKKTIYIANDGTEFENKKECEQYEARYKALLDNPEVIFFDENIEPLTKLITDEDSWSDLFGKSCYINIPSVECFNLFLEAYDEFWGLQFTDCDVTNNNSMIGLWGYNDLRECWENLTEIKAKIDKVVEQANGIVLKEKANHEQKTEI